MLRWILRGDGRRGGGRAAGLLLPALFVALATGCASDPSTHSGRRFALGRDSLAFANELVWEYAYDDSGQWRGSPREPKPEYTHRCFVVARTAKQFYLNARFDPEAPPVDARTYRRLVQRVVGSSPRRPQARPVLIPAFADLYGFSRAFPDLLQQECGGAWQSYFQRGHWRMVFPFSRGAQKKTAERLAAKMQTGNPAVVHLVSFPSLRINHAILLYDADEQPGLIRFTAYDPNQPEARVHLDFDVARETFTYPPNDYYPGGPLNVYEVYRNALY